MSFHTNARRALDNDRPLRQRFVALRSAVERFSPAGFNGTWENLERTVGVTDAANWTSEEIGRAVELLCESRALYMHHRSLWEENRRTSKARGLSHPTKDELAGRGDDSWLDQISRSTKPSRRNYRWVDLSEWARANSLQPGPFGLDLQRDLQEVLEQIPAPRSDPAGSMVAHYGPFPSMTEPANIIEIPYRVYNEPIDDADHELLSERQRLIVDCWYSRSNDGYLRQRHLKRIVQAKELWVIPYVIAALGDYVVEIVHEVHAGLKRLGKPTSWHQQKYRQFVSENPAFVELVRQRAISYRHCYYTAAYARNQGGRLPQHPAFAVLDQLEAPHLGSRRYPVPAS